MDEPVVTRATIRVEYSDGRVAELDVPNPRDARVEVTPPDLPPLPPFDPAYLVSIPLPAAFWRVEMTMDATPHNDDQRRHLITVSEKPYLLDPDLVPYLDWPADWEENEVWCSKPDCTIGDCGNNDPESRTWICSRYHLTARELLAGIRKHADDAQSGTD